MKRIGTLGVAAAVGFGLILGLAGADSKRVTDPAGDSISPGFDIVKAKAKHKGQRKLVHTVTMDGDLAEDLSDHQISLQLNRDGDRACEREFNASGPGRTPLIRCGIGEGQKSARVTKPNARTLKFTFKIAGIIGDKPKYGWRFRVRDCPGGPPCAPDDDSLPDDGPGGIRYVKHSLDD